MEYFDILGKKEKLPIIKSINKIQEKEKWANVNPTLY
jgi:hypothetical protein